MPSVNELGTPDEDTLRILVSTDNHLGYVERDPVRGLDSFAAFEEVLYLAKKYQVRPFCCAKARFGSIGCLSVRLCSTTPTPFPPMQSDMVLLAGDLFHDNKPSRRTLHKTMEILKRYTMGPDPVQIQILSKNNFAHGEANYLQEYYSVGTFASTTGVCLVAPTWYTFFAISLPTYFYPLCTRLANIYYSW
jgi:double-strand break repair protein MRE11